MKKHKATVEEAENSLNEHVKNKALEARKNYLDELDKGIFENYLKDSNCVRFPVQIVYSIEGLQSGEFAYPQQNSEKASDGYTLFVHPKFEHRKDLLPLIVAYHMVVVNYGDIVTNEQAELYGATLLNMPADVYYQKLCEIADSLN